MLKTIPIKSKHSRWWRVYEYGKVLPGNLSGVRLSDLVSASAFDLLRALVRTEDFNQVYHTLNRTKKALAFVVKIGEEKVMFVRGTVSAREWAYNAVEGKGTSVVVRDTHRRVAFLDRVCKEFDVDVLIGHSRGALLVGLMKSLPSDRKFSINGATNLLPRSLADVPGIGHKHPVDRGLRSKYNKTYKSYIPDSSLTVHLMYKERHIRANGEPATFEDVIRSVHVDPETSEFRWVN